MRWLSTILMVITVFFTTVTPCLALEPHIDPVRAPAVFNGKALFNYYASVLETMLTKDHETVNDNVQALPFINIPDRLSLYTDSIRESMAQLSDNIKEIDEKFLQLNNFLQQSRFDEALETTIIIEAEIDQAINSLESLGNTGTITRGFLLNMLTEKPIADMEIAYDFFVSILQNVEDLLALYLERLGVFVTGITNYQNLLETRLGMQVYPNTVYVGDSISVEGYLVSKETGMANREIEIFINSQSVIKIVTDDRGYYQTNIDVPYVYKNSIEIQAFYFPKGADIGVYFAAISAPEKIKTLYYHAEILLELPEKSYPGKETQISVRVGYPLESIPLIPRRFDLYLNGELWDTVVFASELHHTLTVPPALRAGTHNLSIATGADRRYAPAQKEIMFTVTKAPLFFVAETPSLHFIPGNLNFSGRITSEFGEVDNALLNISLEEESVTTSTDGTGNFQVSLETGWDFSLFGYRSLYVNLAPLEPWHANTMIRSRVFTVNIINSAALLLILMSLSLYLAYGVIRYGIKQRRLTRARRAVYGKNINTPIYRKEILDVVDQQKIFTGANRTVPRDEKLFNMYRTLVIVLQRIVSIFMKPNQTLREFADGIIEKIGPFAGPFQRLTLIVEKVIYSNQPLTNSEFEDTVGLAEKIRKGLEK